MFKYVLSLLVVSVLAVSAQAGGGYGYGYGYQSYPQRVIRVERVVTPHVSVRREFVEVPGLVYASNYHDGVVVNEVRIERVRNNREFLVQRVVVDRRHGVVVERVVLQDQHGRQRVIERVVDHRGRVQSQRVVRVQFVRVQQQNNRRGRGRR